MNSTAKNLEAIDSALRQHNERCSGKVTEIRLNSFEVERLGWDDFRGIPIVGDQEVGTGRIRLVCNGEHMPAPAPAAAVEVPQSVEAVPQTPTPVTA